MTMYDSTKSNIMRQELQLVEAGQHYKVYSARVKYLPENVEKTDFFKLCYGMLNKCDELSVFAVKAGSYEVLYKFIVTSVDIDNKDVTVRLLSKIDFLSDKPEESTDNTEATTKAGDSIDLVAVKKLVTAEIKKVSEVVAELDTKIEALREATEKYQSDTDDQLEEIETKLEELINGEETT